MDIPLPGPIVLPRPRLPTPHPAPPLPIPHPVPHPESPLPSPTPDLPAPADELPSHSPIPPTYIPPLPNLPQPLPAETAEPAAEAEAALPPSGLFPMKRRRSVVEDDTEKLLRRIVKQFPPCRFIAAYGSGVFQQLDASPPPSPPPSRPIPAPLTSLTSAPPMLDLLLVVDDVLAFHTENLARHPSHYSFLQHFGGAHTITSINTLPAYLYYNTNVSMLSDQPSQLVKYGVISTERVTDDLTRWTTLYTAGRMHKPVRILQSSPSLTPPLTANLSSALTVACFLSPTAELSDVELYTLLTSLSYMGDVRMGIAEDPAKIVRIVTGSYLHFQHLYTDHIARCEWLQPNTTNPSSSGGGLRSYRISAGEADRRRMVDALPSHLYDTLSAAAVGSGSGGGGGGRWWEGVGVGEQQARMRAGLASIVRTSSWQQSMKGVLTAGVRKGLWYGLRKVAKRWK